MRTTRISSTKKIAVGVALFSVGTVGTAAAFWSAAGNGQGQARSLSAVQLTITAATGAADLFPGFTAGDVSFTVSNPNPYPVTFTAYSGATIVSADPTNCPNANVSVAASGSVTPGLVVGANASGVAGSIPDIVSMATTAPDGCQGKTFTVTLTLTGTQT